MITIEEFLMENGCKRDISSSEIWNNVTIHEIRDIISIHTQEALKQASEKVVYGEGYDDDFTTTQSILNAYPLENIK